MPLGYMDISHPTPPIGVVERMSVMATWPEGKKHVANWGGATCLSRVNLISVRSVAIETVNSIHSSLRITTCGIRGAGGGGILHQFKASEPMARRRLHTGACPFRVLWRSRGNPRGAQSPMRLNYNLCCIFRLPKAEGMDSSDRMEPCHCRLMN